MKKTAFVLGSVLLAAVAVGYEIHHPNLRDAYQACEDGIKHVKEAQAYNKGIEFGGHADRALEAFRHAEQELILGDQYNDAHQKK